MTEYASLVLKVDSKEAKSAQDDLKGLQAEGGRAEGSFANLGKAAAAAGAAIGAAAVAAAGMVAASIQAADAAGEAAASAGMSAEQFTRLQYAMQFDGSPEQLGQSMLFLNKAVADAASGAGKNAEMFAAMGVSISNQDGTLRSSRDIMMDVSDRFAGMEDGAQKAALATELFGRSGAEMIPFLNNGSAGIAQLEAEADRLGVTITDNTAAAAGHLNDTFGRLKSAGAGLANQVMVAMMPSLTALGDEMVSAANNSGVMEMAGKALVVVLKSVMTAAVVVSAVIKQIGDTIGATAAAAVAAASGDFAGAWEIIKKGYGDTVENISGTMTRIDAIWNASATAVEQAEARKVAAVHATAAAIAQPAAAAPAAAAGPLAATPSAPGAPAGPQTPVGAEMLQMQQDIIDYDALLDEHYASALAKQQAYEAQAAQIQSASNQAKRLEALDYLGDMASVFAGQSRSMLIAQKAAAMPAAFLAIKTGIAQALALPFPANLGAAAKVASVGKGVYDAIKSVGGGGGGGSISAPSAGGGLSIGSTGTTAAAEQQSAQRRPAAVDFRMLGLRPDDMVTASFMQKAMEMMGERLADSGGRMGKVELVMA